MQQPKFYIHLIEDLWYKHMLSVEFKGSQFESYRKCENSYQTNKLDNNKVEEM